MDDLARILNESLRPEQTVISTLKQFNELNASNFDLNGSSEMKQNICQILLQSINPITSTTSWSYETISYSLVCLRILCRGRNTLPLLCTNETLGVFASLGDVGITKGKRRFNGAQSEPDIQVIVESVKCLCNVYLMNKQLVSGSADLGIIEGLSQRLSLHQTITLPHDIVYYDLRLLFLLTACDPGIRLLFREKHNGLSLMNSIIDVTLFNTHHSLQSSPQSPPKKSCDGVSLCDTVMILSHPLTDNSMNILCETLKIIFNQTVHWSDEVKQTKEEIDSFSLLICLLRVLLVSLPAQISELSFRTISHVAEVLVNSPNELAGQFLLPSNSIVTKDLCNLYPELYCPQILEADKIVEGGVVSGVGTVYTLNLDHVFEGCNMAPIICLLNYLHLSLCGVGSHNSLPPVVTALRKLSKANRTIRRFLKIHILPPLRVVTGRPEDGNSLKSKLVSRMTAAGGQGAEDIISDLLFVLCKENTARLIKYTGYGNAAGLLMSRGLLGGTPSKGAADYSSDEESSDTEEYIKCQPKVDEMTGGLERDEVSPLDGMTDEEKEQEAIKLNDLIHRLNSQGIFKMMPLTESQPSPKGNDDSD